MTAHFSRLGRHFAAGELGHVWRFGTVGALGLLVNSSILWVLTERAAVYYLVSSVVATEVAILFNFVLNHRWTFSREHDTQSLAVRAVKFNLVSIGGLALTVSALFVLKQFAGLPYLLANAVAAVCAAGWNYAANRRWTWRIASALHGQKGV